MRLRMRCGLSVGRLVDGDGGLRNMTPTEQRSFRRTDELL